MNRSELQNALTRLLNGETLSSVEVDALDQSLQAMSPDEFEELARDRRTDHLLRAASLDSAEIEAASDEPFVAEVISRITASPSLIPPPIEPSVSDQESAEVRLIHELRKEPKSDSRGERTRPRGQQVWWILASVAAVTLIVITLNVATQSQDQNQDVAASDPGPSSTDKLVVTDPEDTRDASALPSSQPADMNPDSIVAQSPRDIGSDSEPVSGADRHSVAQADTNAQHPESPHPPRPVQDNPAVVPQPIAPAVPEPKPESPTFVDSGTSDNATSAQTVAVLSSSDSARWKDASVLREGLSAGPLSLTSGTAKLTLAQGAEVTLAGPVDMKLIDKNTIALQSGSVEAMVPAAAVGFEVQTPGARIVDLGTRFQVRSLPDQEVTRVDVVEGVVSIVQSTGQRGRRERKFPLTAGRTKWLAHDGISSWDWQLSVKFGDPVTAPNQLSIDGQPFDLGRADQSALAMQNLGVKFADASRQIAALPRGQRFSGRLTVDDKLQKLSSPNALSLAQTELLTSIRKRWTHSFFDNLFPQGLPVEMEQFFEGNGISIPGVNP